MTSPTTPSELSSDSKTDQIRDAAADVSEQLKSGAQDTISQITDEASRAAHRAQDGAADEVGSIASAMRTAANELRSGSPQERTFSQLADGLADVSDAMKNKDLGEMMGELNAFARRNPAVFLGGALLLGFAATRFAKASSEPHHNQSSIDTLGGNQQSAYRFPTPQETASGYTSTAGQPGGTVASPVINRGV